MFSLTEDMVHRQSGCDRTGTSAAADGSGAGANMLVRGLRAGDAERAGDRTGTSAATADGSGARAPGAGVAAAARGCLTLAAPAAWVPRGSLAGGARAAAARAPPVPPDRLAKAREPPTMTALANVAAPNARCIVASRVRAGVTRR